MDRFLDAIFDLYRWPFFVTISLFKYSLRKLFRDTPEDCKILRGFLKTGFGWTAVLLSIRALYHLDDASFISVQDIKTVVSSDKLFVMLLAILSALPAAIGGWFFLGWRRIRYKSLRVAVVRDCLLIVWSGVVAVILFTEVPLLSLNIKFDQIDPKTATLVEFVQEPMIFAVVGRTLWLLSLRYARRPPRAAAFILICIFTIIFCNASIDLIIIAIDPEFAKTYIKIVQYQFGIPGTQ